MKTSILIHKLKTTPSTVPYSALIGKYVIARHSGFIYRHFYGAKIISVSAGGVITLYVGGVKPIRTMTVSKLIGMLKGGTVTLSSVLV